MKALHLKVANMTIQLLASALLNIALYYRMHLYDPWPAIPEAPPIAIHLTMTEGDCAKSYATMCPPNRLFCPAFPSKPARFDAKAAADGDDQDAITQHIMSIYFSRIRDKLSGATSITCGNENCRPKIVTYACDPALFRKGSSNSEWMFCAGLGDRFRGVISMFYTALATDSVFMLEWENPMSLSEFFIINSELYGLTDSSIDETCLLSSSPMHFKFLTQNEPGTYNVTGQGEVVEVLRNNSYSGMRVNSNSMRALEGIFDGRKFFSEIADIYSLSSFNYLQLVSAALRILFSKPKPRLEWFAEKTWRELFKEPFNTKTVKIGIHMRLGGWGETGRVREHMRCFKEELIRIIAEHGYLRPHVYIATDRYDMTDVLISEIWNEHRIKAKRCSDEPHHIDMLIRHPEWAVWNRTQKWTATATVFRDWLFLTRMDHLIISRSGFSEMASYFSRKPTRRLLHRKTGCVFQDYNHLPHLAFDIENS